MQGVMRMSGFVKVALVGCASAAVGGAAGWYGHRYSTDRQAVDEARAAFDEEKFDLAIRLAQALKRRAGAPQPDADRIIAKSLASQRKWAEAAKAFEGAVLSSPEDYALSAKSLFNLGRLAEALAVLTRGLSAFPGHPSLAETETRIYATTGRAKDAVQSAERLVSVPGKEVPGRLLSGMIHFELKNYDDAADNLKKALALSPNLEGQSPDFNRTEPDFVHEVIAASLLETERAAEAYEHAKAAFERKPNLIRALLGARGAAARKDWPDVREWAKKVLQFDPANVQAQLLRMDAALELGDLDQARESLERLQQAPAPDPGVRHRINVARARFDAAKRVAGSKVKRN